MGKEPAPKKRSAKSKSKPKEAPLKKPRKISTNKLIAKSKEREKKEKLKEKQKEAEKEKSKESKRKSSSKSTKAAESTTVDENVPPPQQNPQELIQNETVSSGQASSSTSAPNLPARPKGILKKTSFASKIAAEPDAQKTSTVVPTLTEAVSPKRRRSKSKENYN